MRLLACVSIAMVALLAGGTARADCYDELEDADVTYRRVRHRHIPDAVRIDGAIAGVVYQTANYDSLVLDCELAAALARASGIFAAHGVVEVRYSSAYSRRRVRKSGRWSRHSRARAIDVHGFVLEGGERVSIERDFEQGLGSAEDCVGSALTSAGGLLRSLSCSLRASGHFDNVLDPDYDAHHFNHYHLDVP